MLRILAILFLIPALCLKAQVLEHYSELGRMLLYSGEVNCAFECLMRGDKYNNIDSRYYLGLCYELGLGTPQDKELAFLKYRKAAEGGNAYAKAAVAKMLMRGDGVQANPTKAKYWIDKFLMDNHPFGYYLKGVAQLEGYIYPQNTTEALRSLQKAIDNNVVQAYIYMAFQLIDSEVLDENPYEAAKLIDRACQLAPENYLCLDKKGEFLLKLGLKDQAYKLWLELTKKSPAYAMEYSSVYSDFMRKNHNVNSATINEYNNNRANVIAMVEENDVNSIIYKDSQRKIDNQPIVYTVAQTPIKTVPAQPSNTSSERDKKKEASLKEFAITSFQNKPPGQNQSKIVSDIDENIPDCLSKNENTFAVILANEEYQDVANVEFALRDGELMSKYCTKTLGLPESNVHLVKNATLNNIKREINWLKQISEAYKGDINILIYYAGHGVPDESTKEAYLLPVDGFGGDLSTGYALKDLYETLSTTPSKSSIVFLDACFSGVSREGKMVMAARGVAIKPKTNRVNGNMVVVSAAQNDETAYPYKEYGHGLFTYFLLKKLKETKGTATLGEIKQYVIENVSKKSIVVNGKSQTPTVTASEEIENVWQNWRLTK